jgi:Zn-dependent alcohol dehydrogenase
LRTKAAALFSAPGKWEIVEVDLESPRQDELLIKMAAAGLCHSDDHILTGDLPVPPEALPIIGGHEGAGVVAEVGPNTPGWKVGDRVVLTFLLPRAADDVALPISLRHIVLYQKRLQGSLFGASSPSKDIPALLDMYRQGRLKLDELITRRYTLDDINDGYDDMRAGRNLRGIIDYQL